MLLSVGLSQSALAEELLSWSVRGPSPERVREDIQQLYPELIQGVVVRDRTLWIRLSSEADRQQLEAVLEQLDTMPETYRLFVRWGKGVPLSAQERGGFSISTNDGLEEKVFRVTTGSSLLLERRAGRTPDLLWEGRGNERGVRYGPEAGEQLLLSIGERNPDGVAVTLQYAAAGSSVTWKRTPEVVSREEQVRVPAGHWFDASAWTLSGSLPEAPGLNTTASRELLEIRLEAVDSTWN